MAQGVTVDHEQHIDNKSFDPTYQLQQVVILGYDAVNGVLRPVSVDATGELQVV